jgi:hypothetical protein
MRELVAEHFGSRRVDGDAEISARDLDRRASCRSAGPVGSADALRPRTARSLLPEVPVLTIVDIICALDRLGGMTFVPRTRRRRRAMAVSATPRFDEAPPARPTAILGSGGDS